MTPPDIVASATSPATGTVVRLFREILRGNRWLLIPALLGAVGVPGVAILIHNLPGATLNSISGPLTSSVWEFAGQPVRWVLFAAGVVVGIGMPVVVAHGITRWTFAVAGALNAGVVALASGFYMAVGYLVERGLYTAYDLPPVLRDRHLFTATDQVHLVFTEYTLLSAVYLIAGWLVAACYYRLGALRGTLCLPLSLLPIVALEASLLASTWVRDAFLVIFTGSGSGELTVALPAVLRIGLMLAVLAAGLAAVRLVTRRLPLRAPGA